MSIKINRDDHFTLFLGLVYTFFIGAMVGAMIGDVAFDKILAGTFIGSSALMGLWVSGWVVFHLTRPPE